MANPYNPQNPADPNYFGGRKKYLEIVKERIESTVRYKKSSGILVYGYRGIGKTSMLYKIMAEAKIKWNCICVYRRLSSTTTDRDLYRIMSEDVIEEIKKEATVLDRLKDATGKISTIHAQIFDIDIRTEAEKSPYYLWRKVCDAVRDVEFIMVEIDDADYLSPEALGELKTIVEAQSKTPLILVASGGENFEEKLDKDYSPIARVFSGASFNLDSFTLSEIEEVLKAPVEDTDVGWDAQAVQKVHDLSNGYPYLVQCLAWACYIEKGVITAGQVEEKLTRALDIGRPWLSNEIRTASDNDVLSFFRIAKLNKRDLTSTDIMSQGVSAIYIGRLVRLKILKKISRGRYHLIKAPIVAYYHMLYRKIKE